MDLPEVSPATNHALHRSEIVRWPTFPDLKPNSMLHALSCSTPPFAFPHLPQNDIPSKLRMGQDLLPHLSSSKTDRVKHALSVSANSPIWQSACNRLAHGMGRGIRRARQFDERSNSLAPRDIFRRVSPGLWRSRWAGFTIRDGFHGSLLGGRVDPRNAERDNRLRNGGVSGGCGHTRRGKKRRCEPIRESLIEPDISRTHVSYFGLVGNAAADDGQSVDRVP